MEEGTRKLVKKIVGFLLVAAIFWLVYDNGLFPVLSITKEVKDDEVVGSLSSGKGVNVRPLKAEFVSFNKSFSSSRAYIGVKNIDDYAGDITVIFSCTLPIKSENKTEHLLAGQTKLFEFNNTFGRCDNYSIEPHTIRIES